MNNEEEKKEKKGDIISENLDTSTLKMKKKIVQNLTAHQLFPQKHNKLQHDSNLANELATKIVETKTIIEENNFFFQKKKFIKKEEKCKDTRIENPQN